MGSQQISCLNDGFSEPKQYIDKGSRFVESVYLSLYSDMTFIAMYNVFVSSSVYFKELFESRGDPVIVEAVVCQVSQSSLILAQEAECVHNQVESANLPTGHDLGNTILTDGTLTKLFV